MSVVDWLECDMNIFKSGTRKMKFGGRVLELTIVSEVEVKSSMVSGDIRMMATFVELSFTR